MCRLMPVVMWGIWLAARSEFFLLSQALRKIIKHAMEVHFLPFFFVGLCCSWLIALVELLKAFIGTNQ